MNNVQTAEYLLNAIRSAGADKGECTASDSVKTEVYYESGKISMLRSVFNTNVSVKLIKDGKKGRVGLNSTDPEKLDKAVANAIEASADAIPDPEDDVAELTENADFVRGELTPDREGMYNALRAFVDTVKAEYPSISFDSISVEHNLRESTYLNTNGVRFTSRRGGYQFSVMFMAKDGDKTSSFIAGGAEFEDINKPLINHGMVRRLLEEGVRQVETRVIEGKLEGGEVILSPTCVAEMIAYIQGNFISDGVLMDGTSLWKDSLGAEVAAPCFTWKECPCSPELAGGYSLTGDGYAVKDMPVIENGVLKNFTLSRYGAAKTGLSRSANYGGCPIVDAGDTALEDMISSTESGIIMNRFSGGSPGANGDITGVAKNSFLIEKGRVTDALSEVMISGNLAAMLKDIVEISRERVNDGSSILPWIKVRNVVISGK